jgi:hypothetical protein
MNSHELTLRKRALEALEGSTKMLLVAVRLLKQGNRVEADRVREEARTQRTISTLLLAEANRLQLSSQGHQYATRPHLGPTNSR